MTTVTLTVEYQGNVAEIYSILAKYGVTNLRSSKPLPSHILKVIEKVL